MKSQHKGLLLGIAAFVFWGLSPYYFKAISAVTPYEIIAHRIIWSILSLAIFLGVTRSGVVSKALEQIKQQGSILALSAGLLCINWLAYVYAINNDRVLEASLGYFINPLVNVALAAAFLQERLSKTQKFAVLLGILGVLQEVVRFGQIPYLAIIIGLSFGIYGLIRKKAQISGSEGLFIETLILGPFAMTYLMYLTSQGQLVFLSKTLSLDLLLLSAGVVTILPLIWFISASKKLTYTSIGMLQYIGPTLMGILGYWLYQEAFPEGRLITFALIWTGLIAIVVEQLFSKGRKNNQ